MALLAYPLFFLILSAICFTAVSVVVILVGRTLFNIAIPVLIGRTAIALIVCGALMLTFSPPRAAWGLAAAAFFAVSGFFVYSDMVNRQQKQIQRKEAALLAMVGALALFAIPNF